MNNFETESGKKSDKEVKVYALSTCPWCKKTKKLLKKLDVEYKFVDVDKVPAEDQGEIKEEITEHNPGGNVPTVVVNDGEEVIVGHKEEKIRELFEDE